MNAAGSGGSGEGLCGGNREPTADLDRLDWGPLCGRVPLVSAPQRRSGKGQEKVSNMWTRRFSLQYVNLAEIAVMRSDTVLLVFFMRENLFL